jgi:phosphoribosylformylglycinamidine synthase
VARRKGAPHGTPKADALGALPLLLDDPTIASKRWVYQQYDSTVQAETVLGPGGDAGVLRIPGTSAGLAVSVDCNQRYVLLDPYEGGKAAVAEAARNVACTGAVPLGITDCLNFGNPDKPEVFFQFREACRGIGDACRVFGTPVTGGNVSLYNESPTGSIDPTPTVGMVGLLDQVAHRVPSHFQMPGDSIVVLGASRGHLGGSSYWEVLHGFVGGAPPAVDLEAEHRLQELLVAAARGGLLGSAHDCSDGGLAVALAEACIGGPYAATTLGAAVNLPGLPGTGAEALLYGEDAGRVVVSCRPDRVRELLALAETHGVPAEAAGSVGRAEGPLEVHFRDRHTTFAWDTRALRRGYFEAIPRRMNGESDGGTEGR